MSQPELNIVIPFLNEEQVLPLLRERLESIRNRSAGWELIFVSDGSTDGTTRIHRGVGSDRSICETGRANAELRPSKCDLRRPLIRIGKLRRNYGRGFAGRTRRSPGNVSDIALRKCGARRSTTSLSSSIISAMFPDAGSMAVRFYRRNCFGSPASEASSRCIIRSTSLARAMCCWSIDL
jgi:glycosyltransferase involved in cell wall biosynthesis